MAYTLISTQTLLNPAASVTFSSIPQTYKDLVLEFVGYASVATDNLAMRFNGDLGNNYSDTYVAGNGTAASSTRRTNVSSMNMGNYTPASGSPGFDIINIMSYSSGSVYKTAISRNNDASNWVASYVGLWRSTVAITSITLICPNGNVGSGTTFKLWGVS